MLKLSNSVIRIVGLIDLTRSWRKELQAREFRQIRHTYPYLIVPWWITQTSHIDRVCIEIWSGTDKGILTNVPWPGPEIKSDNLNKLVSGYIYYVLWVWIGLLWTFNNSFLLFIFIHIIERCFATFLPKLFVFTVY